jgi:hypothetical protein
VWEIQSIQSPLWAPRAGSLGKLHQSRGKPELARPLLQEAASGRRHTLGAAHPHTLSSVAALRALQQEMMEGVTRYGAEAEAEAAGEEQQEVQEAAAAATAAAGCRPRRSRRLAGLRLLPRPSGAAAPTAAAAAPTATMPKRRRRRRRRRSCIMA